jgi:phage tail-like protein
MSVGERTDPYLGYRFLVEADSIIVGGFSEVSGLSVEMETEEYREGGVNTFTHQFPTRLTHPNLVLRRGLTDDRSFFEWMQDAAADTPIPLAMADLRRNVRVVLLDSEGRESWGWEVRNAFPTRWEGPELGADQGAVAIETLELAHEGISAMEGLP